MQKVITLIFLLFSLSLSSQEKPKNINPHSSNAFHFEAGVNLSNGQELGYGFTVEPQYQFKNIGIGLEVGYKKMSRYFDYAGADHSIISFLPSIQIKKVGKISPYAGFKAGVYRAYFFSNDHIVPPGAYNYREEEYSDLGFGNGLNVGLYLGLVNLSFELGYYQPYGKMTSFHFKLRL